MINSSNLEFCGEFYVVEKTIEVVVKISGENQTIRVEALQSLHHERYCTRAYIKEHINLQPIFPQTGGKFDRKPEDMCIWVDYKLPWTDRESADEALNQALDFLKERCS